MKSSIPSSASSFGVRLRRGFGLSLFGALLASTVLVGCGGDDSNGADMSGVSDLSASLDMPSTGCTTVANWPNDTTYSFFVPDPFDGYDAETGIYGDKPGTGSLVDSLGIEIYNQTGATPTYPKTITIAASGGYNDCDDCVVAYLGQNYDTQTGGTFYFATGGTITVTKADRNPNGGSVAISGSKLHLVEWTYDDSNDKAKPNGKCLDVTAFSFTADYDSLAGDGGTDM